MLEPGKETEIDSDLTMLQGDPEPSYADILKNSGPLSTKGTVSEEGKNFATTANNEVFGQEVDEDLDQFGGFGEDLNSVRSRNQSGFVKGLKAIGSGLYQGGLIALEQLGYVADIDTYANLFREVEDLSGNWWTRAMKTAQEEGRESDLFKIYEDAPDENSLMSQIFKWSSLESAISSSVGFGITGAGAAKFVSFLGATKQFAKLGKFTDEVLGKMAGGAPAEMLAAQGATKAFTGPLATSTMSNYFMAQMMATETYKQTLETFQREGLIGDGEGQVSMLEAQKAAANNAQEIVGLNMALTATSYIKFGKIFKKNTRFDGLVSNPNAAWQIKELIKKGSPTAFAENVYQEMIQMEQIYDTKDELQVGTKEYSDDFWSRMTELALSDRALHAGALGVAGGPLQFAIIQRPFMGKAIKKQREAFQNQQEGLSHRNFKENSLEWHKELISNKLDHFKNLEGVYNKAVLDGDKDSAEMADGLQLAEEISNSLQWGYFDALKHDIEKVKELSAEEAKELGYDNEYKEHADKVLRQLDLGRYYNTKYLGKANVNEIVYTQLAVGEGLLHKQKLNKKSNELTLKLEEALKSQGVPENRVDVFFAEANFKSSKNIVTVKKDPRLSDISKLSTKELTDIQTADLKLQNTVDNILYSMPEYQELKDISKSLDKVNDFLVKVSDKVRFITSKEGEAAYIKRQKENAKNPEAKAEEVNEQKVTEEEIDESIPQTGFEAIQLEDTTADPVVQAERAKNLQSWKDTPLAPVRVKGPENKYKTFTSFDKVDDRPAIKREFTPHDLVRSHTGRYFKVLTQHLASQTKGKMKGANLPVLIETNERGFVKKGAKSFELTDFSYLRPEVLQIARMDGRIPVYGKNVWGPYTSVDGILKPNNFSSERGKKDRAFRGEVIAAERIETLKPNDTSFVPTEEAEIYDLSSLNDVMYEGEEIDVVFKPRAGVGTNYIDVYQGGVRVNRLSRNSNYNYNALNELLAKNPNGVKGKLIGKYTNTQNLVKIKDPDTGGFVKFGLEEYKNANKMYLPGGKIILSQSAAKYTDETAVDTTIVEGGESAKGASVSGNLLYYTDHNGVERVSEIPYHSMNSGDVYMLVITPAGSIMPVATSNKGIKELNSLRGNESYLDDVLEDFEKAAYEFSPSIMKDEQTFDDELYEKIKSRYTGGVDIGNSENLENTIKEEFKKEKEEALGLLEVDEDNNSRYSPKIKKALDELVFTHFRTNDKTYLYETNSEGKGTPMIRYIGKKKHRIVNPNLFKVGMGLDSNGKLSPYIKVRSKPPSVKAPVYHRVGGKAKAFYSAFEKVFLTSDKARFVELLGTRRSRLHVNTMAKATSAEDVNNILFNSGITSEINPAKMFANSSATYKVTDPDFKSASEKAASKLPRFKVEDEAVKSSTVEKIHKEKVLSRLQQSLSNDNSDYLNFESFAATMDTDEVIDHVISLIQDAGITKEKSVIDEAIEIIETETNELGELESDFIELRDSIDETTLVLQNPENIESILKGVLAINKVITKIQNEDVELRTVPVDLLNPENSIFPASAPVYHKTLGYGSIGSAKNGKYTFIPQSRLHLPAKDRRPVKASPHQIFAPNSKYIKLFALDREIAKLKNTNSEYYKNKVDIRNDLRNKLYGKKVQEKNDDVKSYKLDLRNLTEPKKVDDFEKLFNITRDLTDLTSIKYNSLDEGEVKSYADYLGKFSSINFIASASALQRAREVSNGLKETASPKIDVTIKGKVFKGANNTVSAVQDSLALEPIRMSDVSKVYDSKYFEELLRLAELYDAKHKSDNKFADAVKQYQEAVNNSTFYKEGSLTAMASDSRRSISIKYGDKEGSFDLMPIIKADGMTSLKSVNISIDFKRDMIASLFQFETEMREKLPDNETPKVDSRVAKLNTDTKKDSENTGTNDNDSVGGTPADAVVGNTDAIEKLEEEKSNVIDSIEVSEGNNATWVEGGKTYETSLGIEDAIKTITDKYDSKIAELKGEKIPSSSVISSPSDVLPADKKAEGIDDVSDSADNSSEDIAIQELLEDVEISPKDTSVISDFMEKNIEDAPELTNNLMKLIARKGGKLSSKVVKKWIEDYDNRTVFKEKGNLDNEQFNEEIKEVKNMLPHIEIQVLEGVGNMVNKFGRRAIGAFNKGVIYLVDKAETGTAYHEAFHAIAGLHLRPFEKSAIAKEYGKTTWNLELEEKVADDFAAFVKKRKSVLSRLKEKTLKWFKSLLTWRQKSPSISTTEEVFEKLWSGHYANDVSSNHYKGEAEYNNKGFNFNKFKSVLLEKDALTLQNLIDNNLIKIVC